MIFAFSCFCCSCCSEQIASASVSPNGIWLLLWRDGDNAGRSAHSAWHIHPERQRALKSELHSLRPSVLKLLWKFHTIQSILELISLRLGYAYATKNKCQKNNSRHSLPRFKPILHCRNSSRLRVQTLLLLPKLLGSRSPQKI